MASMGLLMASTGLSTVSIGVVDGSDSSKAVHAGGLR